MRQETYSLDVKQGAGGTGVAFPARNLRDKNVQIVGVAGGGVTKIEGTIDGVNWVLTGGTASNMTADGLYTITETFDQIRTNRTTQGTGNPTVTLTGYNVGAR